MEKVTVKSQASHFDGYLRGYKFFKGEAKDVDIKDAKFMEKQFGVEIVKPEAEAKVEEAKPEQPKQKAKPKSKAKSTSKKKAD